MCGDTIEDDINNECIRWKLGLVPISDKMGKQKMLWSHVWETDVHITLG